VSRAVICKTCGGEGHYAKTCPNGAPLAHTAPAKPLRGTVTIRQPAVQMRLGVMIRGIEVTVFDWATLDEIVRRFGTAQNGAKP